MPKYWERLVRLPPLCGCGYSYIATTNIPMSGHRRALLKLDASAIDCLFFVFPFMFRFSSCLDLYNMLVGFFSCPIGLERHLH